MEAFLEPVRVDAPRKADGDKARRIVAAMRSSLARRGAAGSTFTALEHDLAGACTVDEIVGTLVPAGRLLGA